VNVELLHQFTAVSLGCLDADAQALGDLRGCVPFSDPLQHLALAGRQALKRRLVLAEPPETYNDDVLRNRPNPVQPGPYP
jgi:hypothetical protein